MTPFRVRRLAAAFLVSLPHTLVKPTLAGSTIGHPERSEGSWHDFNCAKSNGIQRHPQKIGSDCRNGKDAGPQAELVVLLESLRNWSLIPVP